MATKKIPLDAIELEGCQSRAGTCESTVAEYAELWEAKSDFPPVTLFSDGSSYYCGDGHHRILGAQRAGVTKIEATIIKGGKSDALLYSASANASHGKRRTNADKRKAVKIVLDLHAEWSDRAIAEHCSVGPDLVGSVRSQVSENDTSKAPAKRTGRDGKQYPAPKPAAKQSGKDESSATDAAQEQSPGRRGASGSTEAPGDLAKKNKTLAHAHRDKLARAICDYHEVCPNRKERDRLVKLVQGVELW